MRARVSICSIFSALLSITWRITPVVREGANSRPPSRRAASTVGETRRRREKAVSGSTSIKIGTRAAEAPLPLRGGQCASDEIEMRNAPPLEADQIR